MRNSKIEVMVLKAKLEFLEQVLLHKCDGDQNAVAHAKEVVGTYANIFAYGPRREAREHAAKVLVEKGELKNPWAGTNLSIDKNYTAALEDGDAIYSLYLESGQLVSGLFDLCADLDVLLDHYSKLDAKKAKPAPVLIGRQLKAQAAAQAVASHT